MMTEWTKEAELSREPACAFGDWCVSDAYMAVFTHSSGCFEVRYCAYVEETQTENLPEVRTAYVVNERTELIYLYAGTPENPEWETADYEYGDGDALYYDTIEAAERCAKRYANFIEAYMIGWEPMEDPRIPESVKALAIEQRHLQDHRTTRGTKQ